MQYHSHQKGFTLVETLLAVAILSMAVVAPLSIASRGLAAATTGKDRFIATALAREAVEYIRNARDTNRLGNQSWLYGITNAQQCTDKCAIDVLNRKIDKNPFQSSFVLKVDDSEHTNTGLYAPAFNNCDNANEQGNPTCWKYSQFTRYVKVETLPDGREARVTAVVSWQTMFNVKKVEITEQLFNWQP